MEHEQGVDAKASSPLSPKVRSLPVGSDSQYIFQLMGGRGISEYASNHFQCLTHRCNL